MLTVKSYSAPKIVISEVSRGAQRRIYKERDRGAAALEMRIGCRAPWRPPEADRCAPRRRPGSPHGLELARFAKAWRAHSVRTPWAPPTSLGRCSALCVLGRQRVLHAGAETDTCRVSHDPEASKATAYTHRGRFSTIKKVCRLYPGSQYGGGANNWSPHLRCVL